ncbi:hypothetical protein [Bacillus phage SPO1L1]|nr:hypothetical protein [Bacillus phage SPO1L1]WIT26180.1 hypothetical protein [Bacillus phage SPO1L2]
MNELSLYAVIPVGHEIHTCIVPALSRDSAKSIATEKKEAIKALVKNGCVLKCVDLSVALLTQGYNIEVTRVGMYH